MSDSSWARLWAFGLGLATITATLLAVRVNPFEISMAYLALLAMIIIVGLMSNLLGGLAASIVGVFIIVLINRYAGIYPRENIILNIATELASFLAVGPLAGGLAEAIDRVQHQANHWLARAEELSVHDENSGTLKPEWSKVRLDEEVLRARRFSRPLAIALLQFDPVPEANFRSRAERLAALQAVIRMARAATQPPVVIAHAGGDQVLLILPEHTSEHAWQVVDALKSQAASGVYFPGSPGSKVAEDKTLGRPLSQWGRLYSGVASLDDDLSTSEALLAKAQASMISIASER